MVMITPRLGPLGTNQGPAMPMRPQNVVKMMTGRAKEWAVMAGCAPDFLMKRLQKGQKYFDSGDYNMAKAKMKNKQLPSAGADKNLVTGDHIPTPQDLPQRKSSLVTSKLAG